MLAKNLQAAVAGISGAEPLYVESVFSTYLYTGNGSTQTITNGIDLAGEGGLVWIKDRTTALSHMLFDTERGFSGSWAYRLLSNDTNAQSALTDGLSAFNSSGFSLGNSTAVNQDGDNYASWTFRKAPKFFDVVTYTGNGTAGRTVAHNLGSVPGAIFVKRTNTTGQWNGYHRGVNNGTNPQNYNIWLNLTNAASVDSSAWNNTAPTDSVFTVGDGSSANANGSTYVAYLFAHDAGGFGDSGEENVISCGSFTGGSPATIDLGWEPQWILIKSATNSDNWYIFDTMRGWTVNYSGLNYLIANTSGAEVTGGNTTGLRSNGFVFNYGSGQTFVYIAIRRGPMKTPTDATTVFAPVATSGSTGTTHTIGFPLDLQMSNYRTGSFTYVSDRLRGVDSTTNETAYPFLKTSSTDAEATSLAFTRNVNNTSFQTPSFFDGTTQIYWNFRRAPGFFDVVCYNSNSQTAPITNNHNLAVVPEMMIVKKRGQTGDWMVYHKGLNGGVNPEQYRIRLNSTGSQGASSGVWNNTAPTATTFTVGTDGDVNAGDTSGVVAYLFASCPGVSKIGSYTGNGSTQTIDCGFSAGARFVLIKASSTTGDWHVFDTARGIVAGNDPYLELNTTNAEVTSEDAVDPVSSGFAVNEVSGSNINTSSVTYIYLAIA